MAGFVTEANALETNVNAKEANTDADAQTTAANVVTCAGHVASCSGYASAASASAASAVSAPGTSATSTTSLTIGAGSKTLTIQTGKSIVVGMTVKIAYTTTPTSWMCGDVTAYDSGTGALTVNVTDTNGSGTYAAWTVSLSGIKGATGATGATGAKGDTGSMATISRSASAYNSTGIPNSAVNRFLWVATVACTVTSIKGWRVGGSGAVINARKNGSSNHLASGLSLTSASAVLDGGTAQNTSYAIGDYLEFMIVSTSGTVTELGIQINFSVP